MKNCEYCKTPISVGSMCSFCNSLIEAGEIWERCPKGGRPMWVPFDCGSCGDTGSCIPYARAKAEREERRRGASH